MCLAGGVKQRGFTLTELVVVIVIAGILSAIAIPRITDTSDIDQAGAVDELRAALQYARKIAVYSRRYVCVSVAGNVLSLTRDPRTPEGGAAPTPSCSSALDMPFSQNGCAKNTVCLPSSVTVSMAPGNFYFLPGSGAASASAVLTVSGKTLTVDAATGIAQ
jgi:MSHA pilin protein MshC